MRTLLLTLILLCSACDRTEFPKYGLVSGLRVLTLKASSDQGEVDPGTSVTIEPVVSDFGGGGRTLNVSVVTCLDPGIGFGATPKCDSPDSTSTSSFATGTLSSNGTYVGAAPTFTVSVPSSPVWAAAPTYLRYNGIAYLVIYTLTAPDGNSTTAFKRIVISDPSKTAKNKNPSIAGVTANGTALSATQAFSSGTLDLALQLSLGAESYSNMKADGTLETQTEVITTTWYYTDGEMKYQRTGDSDGNHWEFSKPAGRAASLVVVTHDGRGGEDFKVFEFN